ncbi:hypothetical protein HOU25_gp41 [Corynebacterium phage Juicebox]|uniref:Uncharacterized protein n=1 Tax=Corynebacterium phage Juicebox TaxID=2301600 RepID=A0A385UEX1_9CAUD|nr:hypothetical protein HOU25_gp41 [Corynebacterium phage Juicebox]AYB69470.1 hypothetical protein JUICEBOX_41 [Corynebacterium phage Juicebox]
MTVQLLARRKYPDARGRLVYLIWIDPTVRPMRVGALHLGDLCDVMPNSFVQPQRATPPRPPQTGTGRFVSLTELKTWVAAQPDKKTREALANVLAWADAISTEYALTEDL